MDYRTNPYIIRLVLALSVSVQWFGWVTADRHARRNVSGDDAAHTNHGFIANVDSVGNADVGAYPYIAADADAFRTHGLLAYQRVGFSAVIKRKKLAASGDACVIAYVNALAATVHTDAMINADMATNG